MASFVPGESIKPKPRLTNLGLGPGEVTGIYVYTALQVRDVGDKQQITLARLEGDNTLVYARVWKEGNSSEKENKWVLVGSKYINLITYSGAWFRHV